MIQYGRLLTAASLHHYDMPLKRPITPLSRIMTVPQILEQILSLLRSLRAENRTLLIQEEIQPLISDLRSHADEQSTPALLRASLSTIELWAQFIATDSTGWRIYAERLAAHCRALRILAQVQVMGHRSGGADGAA